MDNDAIICDLDKTLALLNGRNPYDAASCEQDSVNEPVRIILASCPAYIILVSGRREEHRPQTERWLLKHTIVYAHLYMRANEDSRQHAVVKREMYEQHVKGRYNVLFVLDDRNRLVQMWRSLDLTCLQVAEGDF